MEILYKSGDKSPSNGDVKILKNGDIFFRAQRTVNGMYVVSYGKPCYEWYSEDNEKVQDYKRDYEDKTKKLFYSTSKTKTKKTKVLKFDFKKESDRKRYEKITGIPVLSDTKIETAKLEVFC